jgi:hypothetical protein
MKTEIKWGVIIAFATFLLLFVEFISGMQRPENLKLNAMLDTFLGLLIPLICLFFSIREKRNLSGSTMTYWEGVKAGLLTTIWAIPFLIIFSYVFLDFVNPDYFNTMIDQSVTAGYHKDTETAAKVFNHASYLMMSILGTLGTGIILSFVLSLIINRSKT